MLISRCLCASFSNYLTNLFSILAADVLSFCSLYIATFSNFIAKKSSTFDFELYFMARFRQ